MIEDKSKDNVGWFYSDKVKEHFFNPQNLIKSEEDVNRYTREADGIGIEGSAACGDVMKMWIKVSDGKIKECKWQTFGCASAISATSIFSMMVTEKGGMKIEDALNIKAKDIVDRLDGLPDRKFHCSVLANRAFKKAIEDYYKKSE